VPFFFGVCLRYYWFAIWEKESNLM
jgi:hypothetical protein